MKKQYRISALILAILMLLPLAACGSTAAETQQEAQPVTEVEAVSETEPETAPIADAAELSADALEEEPDASVENETVVYGVDGDYEPTFEEDMDPDLEEILSSEPYIPENLEKAIIGYDDRVNVTPGAYPFSCIAYMEVEAMCGCTWTASGFMISRYTFMTAAHCLNCVEHDQPYKNIDFYFGYRSPKNYLYKISGMFSSRWGKITSGGNYIIDDDYGYILFNEPVGDTTGWLGYRILSDSEANNELFYNAGYRDGVIKASMGKMKVHNDKLFYHYMDTEGGYSGGPICDDEWYAVGINVAHHGNEYNIARRITSDLIKQMKQNGLLK